MNKGALAINLLELVKDHKKKCKGNCNVSLYMIGKIYEILIGRKLTQKEFEIFI